MSYIWKDAISAGTGITRLIKKLVFLNEWPRSYCRSAHAHALLVPPEGRSGSDCSIFIHPLARLSDARLF